MKQILVITLGLVVFLTDNSNLTSASSFETSSRVSSLKKHNLRLPASAAAKSTLDFDCNSTQNLIEISTEFESVRLQALNCTEKIQVEDTRWKNKLISFPIGKKMYSSEYAFLSRGENKFLVTSGKKQFHISVFRY